ncbi:hypothetical protein HA402_002376 [Bradysia odoriphaga]|nr:hypothetical protein HA402_002376 [Bradysia odoriphaga]
MSLAELLNVLNRQRKDREYHRLWIGLFIIKKDSEDCTDCVSLTDFRYFFELYYGLRVRVNYLLQRSLLSFRKGFQYYYSSCQYLPFDILIINFDEKLAKIYAENCEKQAKQNKYINSKVLTGLIKKPRKAVSQISSTRICHTVTRSCIDSLSKKVTETPDVYSKIQTMNSIRKNDKILLTYYVNPHHFYFKYKEDALGEEKLAELNKEIEQYVHRHIENRHWQNYSPQIGEIVLCHYISDCVYKWIRTRVDYKLNYNKEMFVLWAIDYGFPIETDGRLIRPIEADELRVVYEGLIFKGGLFEIVPSTVEYNFMKAAEEPRKTKKWSSRAVQMVEKYLHQADDLTFKCRAYYEDHFFGSLIIQSLVVADFLKSSKEGVDSDNFVKEFCELDNPPYWQRQQEDALYKIYENNSDFYGSEDVTTTWVTSDDLLSKCETTTDMPKLCEINNKNTTMPDDTPTMPDDTPTMPDDTPTMPDDTLIELSHQLSDSKLSQSCRNSTFSYRTSAASTIATETTQPNVTDTKGATISKVPLKNRLAVAQQTMIELGKMTARKTVRVAEKEKKVLKMTFPAGFIVDNKAIEDKYKEHRECDTKRFDSTNKRNKSRFDKAKEMEEW